MAPVLVSWLSAVALILGLTGTAGASSSGTGLKLSFHAGWHAYREPALDMRLDGPLIGLKAVASPGALAGSAIEFETDLGSINYRSAASGRLDNALRIRTATTLLLGPAAEGWRPRLGLALTTEWTDLRGLTSGGAAGYQRFNRSLWLAAQWRLLPWSLPDHPATVRAGVLVAGWHDSYLSQINPVYGDVTNRQRQGVSLAIDAPWQYEGWRGSLGLRVQRYGDSEIEWSPGLGTVFEPANRSLDLRLSVQY